MASYSPHQNGLKERNHATVDQIMKKMLKSNSRMSPESALFLISQCLKFAGKLLWFFTLSAVVFCEPKNTNNIKSWPLGLENVTKSEVFANNVNALHIARQEINKAESLSLVKKALKTKKTMQGEKTSRSKTCFIIRNQ